MKRVTKCLKCRKRGHNIRTCNKKKISLCDLCGRLHLIKQCHIIQYTIKDDIKIEKRKQQIIYDSIKNEKTNQECSICYESMFNNEVSATTCAHVFHTKCLNNWFKIKRSCPLCAQTQ